jgi:hypothetical protein
MGFFKFFLRLVKYFFIFLVVFGALVIGFTIHFTNKDNTIVIDDEPRFYVNCGNGEPFSGGDQYFEFYHDIFRVYDMKDGKIINDEYHDISLVEERSDGNRTVKTYYCETDQRKFDLVNDNGEYIIRWRDDDGYVWLVVTKCD